jgi:hypothetical protein
MPTITPGIYVHYKSDNMRYQVFGVGRHSETDEYFVVYKPLYETEDEQPDFWVRPYEMFTGDVTIDGKTMPRFRKIDE